MQEIRQRLATLLKLRSIHVEQLSVRRAKIYSYIRIFIFTKESWESEKKEKRQ